MKVVLALGLGKALDGITKSSAGKAGGMVVEKIEKGFKVAFADFAEHPTDGFVNKIVGIGNENKGKIESIFKLVLADESEGRNERNTLFPKTAGFG